VLPVYYYKRPSMIKFIELLNNEDCLLIRKLGSYVFHAFNIRTKFVYVKKWYHTFNLQMFPVIYGISCCMIVYISATLAIVYDLIFTVTQRHVFNNVLSCSTCYMIYECRTHHIYLHRCIYNVLVYILC